MCPSIPTRNVRMFYHIIFGNQDAWANKVERTQENISKVAAESKLSTNKTKAISLWKCFSGMMYGPCLPLPTFQHNDTVWSYWWEPDFHVCCLSHPALLKWAMTGSTVKRSLLQEDYTGRTLNSPRTQCFFHNDGSLEWPNCRCQCHGCSLSITLSEDDTSNSSPTTSRLDPIL